MNCDECHDLLQRRLDGSPPSEPSALERHLAGSPPCRAEHAAAQLLEDHLKRQHKPVPPADLADRIVAGLLAEQQTRVRARRRWLVGMALAASLLLACVAGYRWLRQPGAGGDQPSPLVDRKPKTPQAPAQTPAVATTSLSQTVEEARTAVAALTDRTVTQARQLWTAAPALEVRPVTPWPSMRELEKPLDPAAQSLREAGQGVRAGLGTVTASARRMVDFFLREVPPAGADRKSGL